MFTLLHNNIIIIVASSAGVDDPVYSRESLRRDYKEGMVMGISFCLFAMPSLVGSASDDETDGGFGMTRAAKVRVVDALKDLAEAE